MKSDVLKGGDVFAGTDRDSIIGIGGGAAMDVARAIVLRVHHRRDLFDYDDLIGGDVYVTEEVPYFITVPTTSGTGSEVGRSAIISEDDTHRKRILFSPKLLAKIVFADPLLTMELPPFVTAATGMDALTHNLEAYLAKMYHPMCEGIALQGVEPDQRLDCAGGVEARSGVAEQDDDRFAGCKCGCLPKRAGRCAFRWRIRCRLYWITRIMGWPMP